MFASSFASTSAMPWTIPLRSAPCSHTVHRSPPPAPATRLEISHTLTISPSADVANARSDSSDSGLHALGRLDDEHHREVPAQDGHRAVLEVAVALDEHARELGDDAGLVRTRGGDHDVRHEVRA